MYLANGSNSILTLSISFKIDKLVLWNVCGIIDILKDFSKIFATVNEIPFIATDPFSTINLLTSISSFKEEEENSYSQLFGSLVIFF